MAIVSTYPVNLAYNYGPNVGTIASDYSTSDGIYYSISPLLSAVNSATFNQNTLSVLTNDFLLSNSLSGIKAAEEINYITATTISTNNYGNTQYLTSSPSLSTVIGVTSDITQATLFDLVFNTDNTVSLISNNQYLTVDYSFVPKLEPFNIGNYDTNQSFYYNLNNGKISLFSIVHAGSAVTIDYNTFTSANNLLLDNFTGFTNANVFNLDRYSYTLYKKLGTVDNVKYVPTTNSLDIATATSELPHNYLITAPYYNTDNTTDTLGYNITPLKNYYSPEHIQTPTLSSQSRAYNKLFTGLNTENGSDKIYISYKGQEVTKIFKKDQDNYFHYAVGSQNIPLSASTLVAAGAYPGSSPYRSDRIFVKQANYKEYSSWGNFNGVQNGEFFCSWLSASEIGADPVWMDRYFNPNIDNKVTYDTVLSSPGAGPSNNDHPVLIWDVLSTQILNPESLYIYHRIGDNDNYSVVSMLSANLIHRIQYWTNPIYDMVTGLAAGNAYLPTTNSVATFPYVIYPALYTYNAYATLNLTNKDFYTPGFTIAFQAYNSDWTNIQGDQILGNYYNGGIGLFKNNSLLTPFTSIVGGNSLTTFNHYLNQAIIVTSTTPTSGNNFVLKGRYQETYYTVDTYFNINEYDQDGILISQTNVNYVTGALAGAELLYESGDRVIIVFTATSTGGLNWYRFDTNYSLLLSGTTTNANSYVVDLSGNITYFNGTVGVVDNNNVVWALSGDILIRGLNTSSPQYVLSALNAEYITCDHNNNIWLLYSGNFISKLDNYGRVVWDKQLPISRKFATSAGVDRDPTRIINFIAQLDETSTNLLYYGLVVDCTTQKLFKIDPATGSAISSTVLTNITNTSDLSSINLNCTSVGDTTGYNYQRKYYYITDNNSQELKVRALVENTASLELDSKVVELSYSTATLTPGWHHFAITADPYNKLNLYVDGTLATSTLMGDLSSGVFRVFNQRNNPDLIIGTSSFKTQTLSQYAQTTNPYVFNGYIADVRIYSTDLRQADIKALQKGFYSNSFFDLTWASSTGQRYYIEQIDRFFLHRMPGAKSSLFNVKIKNSNITDPNVRNIIEQNIKSSLSKSTPIYTNLNKIIWD